MTDDRTKLHPRYWHREGRALAIRDACDDQPLAGSIGEPQAIEQSWAHADALIREGYMLALERVRDEADRNANMECSRWAYEAAATVEDQAPGEAE